MQALQRDGKNLPGKNLLRAMSILLLLAGAPRLFSQAALLLEQPYGVFGTINPTGHAAIYFERICADSPVHLRMCSAGERGIIISRYKGLAGYDWVAIPLIPYLYSVEDPAQVPAEVDQETVNRLRNHYRESQLGQLGENLPRGSFWNGGWTELVGTAYDRRTYAFRFATTVEQDRELVRILNERPNVSHFNIWYNNCADFDRFILGHYFPHQFGRTIFPDAGITTPKHITYALVKYAHRHPETQFSILEIPQVPGFRHESRAIHGVAETFFTNGYVIPIVILNPYVAGGLLADYLIRGRYHLVPKNPITVGPEDMDALIEPLPLISTPFASEVESSPGAAHLAGQVVNGEAVVHTTLSSVPE
jgi:hypothetical protein